MEVLRTENLKKYYEQSQIPVKAVDGIDISVEQGEFVAIVGTSGSGKSTLLNMLGGLDRPTEGTVFVDGKDIFRVAGIPTPYTFFIIPLSKHIFFLSNANGNGRTIQNTTYTSNVIVCPIPVAYAAPAIPILGNGPIPNIIRGSNIILAINPHIILIMDTFILPTD